MVPTRWHETFLVTAIGNPTRAHHSRQDRQDPGSAWRGAWDRAHQPRRPHHVDRVLGAIRVGPPNAARSHATRLSRAGPKKMLAEAHPPSSPGRRTTLHHRDRSNNSQNRPRAEHASAAPGSVPTMSSRSGAILRKIASNRYCRGDGVDDLHLGRMLCIHCRRQRDRGQDSCPAAGGCRLPPAWPSGPAFTADEVRNANGLAIL